MSSDANAGTERAAGVVFLNGAYLPRAAAQLDVEDRGTLFGDGVYEVVRYYGGRALRMAEHVERLQRSMAAIALPATPHVAELPAVSQTLLERNGLRDAKVYWQVTRGSAPRNHAFPADPKPTVLAMASPEPAVDRASSVRSVRAILVEDERWAQCWIKSLMLLPNVLARQRALDAGAAEAILCRGATVTEGSSTNVLVITAGTLRTHPANQWILGGITRQIVLELAQREGVPVDETPVTRRELLDADEVMLVGTTTHIAAVTEVDSQRIGAGRPGRVATMLYRAFLELIIDV